MPRQIKLEIDLWLPLFRGIFVLRTELKHVCFLVKVSCRLALRYQVPRQSVYGKELNSAMCGNLGCEGMGEASGGARQAF